MPEEGFKRKLTAILSADVESYSRLMDKETVRTLTAYRNSMALPYPAISGASTHPLSPKNEYGECPAFVRKVLKCWIGI